MTTKRSRDLRVRRSVIDATDQRVGIELDDDGGSAIEVAESNPCWTYSHVHEAGPGSARATVGPRLVVGSRHALQLQSLRLIGDALVLCGALVTLHDTADDERDARISAQIPHLAGVVQGVEHQLERIGHGNSHDCGLRRTLRRDRRLHRQSMRAKKLQELRSPHALAGSKNFPSTSSISVSAHDCRIAFASAYSGELHHRRAVSASANSRITKRAGAHEPSSAVVAPPRERYLPPYFAIDTGARCLYRSYFA